MKMHVLTAAVVASLASRAVLAASEGGDTWSELQPVEESTYSAAESMPRVDWAHISLDPAFEGSEGGDTWSSVQASRESGNQVVQEHLPAVATTANLASLRREQPSVYGTPAMDASAKRAVRLGPGTRWVDVGYGETVRFVVQGGNSPERSFTWRFDVSPARTYVDLRDLVPADFLDHNVRVFVAANRLYRGG